MNLEKEFDFILEKDWLKEARSFSLEQFESLLVEEDESFWQRAGEKRALKIFHQAANRVPAYRDFLKKNKVKPELIKTTKDFSSLPVTDAKNYTAEYPLAERLWDGKFGNLSLVATSSGTSGEPKFWPRGSFQDFEATIVHELLYRHLFQINHRSTLLVVGFPMGIYVSGMATVIPSLLATAGKYGLTIVTAGNNKVEVLKTVKNLGSHYDQTVLIGHPFFLKDVIETGRREGVVWSKYKVKMLFCSEGFREAWRQYLLKEAGFKSGLWSAFNTYGSSELLLMAYETPLSVLVRTLAEGNEKTRTELFGAELVVPNLFQYNPFLRYLESVNGEIIFTASSGVPMIRYNLHDSGSLHQFETVSSVVEKKRPKWLSSLQVGSRGVSTYKPWRLPFVSLNGRSDNTIIFYAANIYPEHIRYALDCEPFLDKLTGKFVMRKDYLPNMDQYLEINIELAAGVEPSEGLSQLVADRLFENLMLINHEYLDAVTHAGSGKDLKPKITLWSHQSDKYFKPGLKPKYIAS